MTPEQKERIRELFLAACEQEPSQRADFLRRACPDDSLVRAEVESLLASDEEADTFLQTPALGATFARAHPESFLPKADAAPADGSSADLGIEPALPGAYPQRVGQYRILDVLGEGGMGVVYRAEQESPRRTVALKVIRTGAESPELLRRFEHEGQVLGWLQHPGIAQIFEAGTAVTGQGRQPFFAMEFVRGQSLTGYAAAQELTLGQRLELVTKVCDAVHHAHQKGVIHRDLKPSNILVDDSGQPKVLDFGVARVTDADIRTTTLQTDVGQLVGTLAYMSPEQVAGDPRQLDTRSDVYALGVILYQLLAGRVPFDVSRQTIAQAARRITEEEPRSLSSINRIFRGDVETIVAKALEKDKNRRYQSAAGLAADIRRCLSDEPISARPASAVYQLRKFARRNKTLTAAVATAFVLLSAALVFVTAERNRARAAERVAEQQREEAERQATIAQAVVDFLNEDLLAAVDPRHTADRAITMKEVLDAASTKIEGQFEDEPLVEAAIRVTLGATYRQLGEYDSAEPHLERALELRRDILGEEDVDTLRTMDTLGVVYKKHGLYDKAEPLLVRAVEICRRALAPDDPHTIACINDLGMLYLAQARHAEAERLLTEVLDVSRRVLGEEHSETLTYMNNLGLCYGHQRRYADAEPLLVQALKLRRSVLGDDHPATQTSINNLGTLYQYQARYAEAEPLLVNTLRAYQRVVGKQHPRTLATMNNLASVYRKQGRYDEAEPLFADALEIRRRVSGAEHPQTLTVMTNLALVHCDLRRYDKAEPLLVEALETRGRLLGQGHPDTLVSMKNLAKLYVDQRRYEEAVPLLRECLELGRTALPEDDRLIAETQSLLGGCLTALGRHEEAEPLLLESYPRIESAGEEDYDLWRATCQRIVDLYEAWDKPEQAAEWRSKLAAWQPPNVSDE